MRGIWFDNVHSYYDLNLVLSEVDIPPATPKTNFVDIPGADGSVDLTEALGEVKFKDRECKFTLTAFPYENFEVKKRQVSNLLNGKRIRIILDKDPDYFWEGRCAVDDYASDRNLHQIVVKATVAPYKLREKPTVVSVKAGENVTVKLKNGRRRAIPTIETVAETTITFRGNTFNLNAGTQRILDIMLTEGTNVLTVTSTGAVKFTYQEGDL